MKRLGVRALLSVIGLVLLAAAAAAAELTPLVVETEGGPRRFQVEVAASDDARRRGLMFRKELPATEGMIFDFGQSAPRTFWMRNTEIPLDILFLDEEGVIRRIHRNAVPFDETPIPSDGPARAVLEIGGGIARLAGISEGDRVRHAIFGDTVE